MTAVFILFGLQQELPEDWVGADFLSSFCCVVHDYKVGWIPCRGRPHLVQPRCLGLKINACGPIVLTPNVESEPRVDVDQNWKQRYRPIGRGRIICTCKDCWSAGVVSSWFPYALVLEKKLETGILSNHKAERLGTMHQACGSSKICTICVRPAICRLIKSFLENRRLSN